TFQPKKRAWVRVNAAQVPYAGGPDDPNQWRLYGTMSSTVPPANGSGMHLQHGAAYTDLQVDIGALLAMTTSGPPSSSNFPNANPAKMRSARTLPSDSSKSIFEVRGDGSGHWGPIQIGDDGKYASSYDTDWVDIPGAVGTTSTLQGRRVGNVVYLRGTVAPSGEWLNATTLTLVSSMPTQFRPSQAFRFVAAPSAVSGDLYFNVQIANSITARSSRAAGPTAVFFPLTYLAD